MSYNYIYLKSKQDFINEMPFTGKEAFEEHVDKYPSAYPCILEFEDFSCNEGGYAFHIEIIEDMSDFIYQNGNLYKIDKESSFIYQDGTLYKKC
jgi:hypothetical protein